MATKTKRKSSKKPTKRALKPTTGQTTPQPSRVFFLRSQTAGMNVTPDTALTYAPFWACVLYISNMMAILPLDHREKRPNGGSDPVESDASDLLNIQANDEVAADVFRKTLVGHACTWGNGYAEIESDMRGAPVWLWQITPDRVKMDRTARGQLVYDVANPRETNTVLLPKEVIHIKGLSYDGLIGYNVIAYAAKSIGAAMAADSSAATIYENDSTPGGLLKHPRRLSENARKDLLDSWQKRHGGPANKRVVALLEEGLEWAQTSMAPEATQLIENRQYGPVDICRWFGVPPHKIGILDRATFSNIESQQIQAVMDCLMPWINTMEKELRIKLIGRNLRRKQQFKFDLKGLLRADSQVRFQVYQWMLDRGVYDINDVLELEDMNPIGKDGDKRFVQRNMITLDQAGMPDQPTNGQSALPPATPKKEPSKNGDGMAKEPMSVLLTPIIADSMRRILSREASLVERANGDIEASLPNIRTKQVEYLKGLLSPSVEALAKTIGNGTADDIAKSAINMFAAEYDQQVASRWQPNEFSKFGDGMSEADLTALVGHYTSMLVRLTMAMGQ